MIDDAEALSGDGTAPGYADSIGAAAVVFTAARTTHLNNFSADVNAERTTRDNSVTTAANGRTSQIAGHDDDFRQDTADEDSDRTSLEIAKFAEMQTAVDTAYGNLAGAEATASRNFAESLADAAQTQEHSAAGATKTFADSYADAEIVWTAAVWGAWAGGDTETGYVETQADIALAYSDQLADALATYKTTVAQARLTALQEMGSQPLKDHAKAIASSEKDRLMIVNFIGGPHSKVLQDNVFDKMNEKANASQDPNDYSHIRPDRPMTSGEQFVTFISGALDGFTMGATDNLREWWGGRWEYAVHEDSIAYNAGYVTGIVVMTALSVGAGGPAACGAGWLRLGARALVFTVDAYGVAEAGYKVYTGEATALDYLNFIPIIGFAAGKLGRAAGLWGCFEAGTGVVMAGLPMEAVTAAAKEGVALDWMWSTALVGVGLAAVVLPDRRRKQSKSEPRSAVDVLFEDDDLDKLPLSDEELDELCEQLVHGDRDDGELAVDAVCQSVADESSRPETSAPAKSACTVLDRPAAKRTM